MSIEMPKPITATEDPNPTAPPINVQIKGHHVQPPIVDTGWPNPGTINDTNFRGTVRVTNPASIGTGPRPDVTSERWDYTLLKPEDPYYDKWPPGLFLNAVNGQIYGTPAPLEVGIFNFNIVLTLPGTMEIIYSPQPLFKPGDPINMAYTITITGKRVIPGDVDGVDGVNLADLILLGMYFNNRTITINYDNAKITPCNCPVDEQGAKEHYPRPPANPSCDITLADLQLLARHFGRQGVIIPEPIPQ